MQCEMCVERLEKTLKSEAGIIKVRFNLNANAITVVYDDAITDTEKIKVAITRTGYQADEYPPNKKAFESLPMCCKAPGLCHPK